MHRLSPLFLPFAACNYGVVVCLPQLKKWLWPERAQTPPTVAPDFSTEEKRHERK